MNLLPFLSLILAFSLGVVIVNKTSIKTIGFSYLFFIVTIGFIAFTAVNYFSSLIFSFPVGVIIAQLVICLFVMLYFFYFQKSIKPYFYIEDLLKEKLLLLLIIILGTVVLNLFSHHIIPSINGDLYTGESTYGDLPFHLSIISQIAYGYQFPPNHPMYANLPLVYPYLINFFSAILVYEGWSLRQSIIIPGLILSISLIGLIYDFVFSLTKSSLKSFLTVVLYFLNGGLGFYFFLQDHSFNLTSIIQVLFDPVSLKEYSHLFEQNIQWVNFTSRMIIPERSLLFGIPAGIIILRLLFFSANNKNFNVFDLILAAFLLSLMPLLHTHTVLAMGVILPVIGLLILKKHQWRKQVFFYMLVAGLAVIFAIPHISLFIGHVVNSGGFLKFHLWWMTAKEEPGIWFWFKNTYILIPLSMLVLLFPKIASKQIKILQICALTLLIMMNIALFSPYDWDNVKFLFWAGLFFNISAASMLVFLLQKNNWLIKLATVIVIFSITASAVLSILREVNVKYVLFSKEAVSIGEQIKKDTPVDSLFLTYKTHNSPISNLAGRSILMGYQGLLWVHGIDYQQRDQEINDIYSGSLNARELIQKYGINYIVVEQFDPKEMVINRDFLSQYPIFLKTQNYTIYQVK